MSKRSYRQTQRRLLLLIVILCLVLAGLCSVALLLDQETPPPDPTGTTGSTPAQTTQPNQTTVPTDPATQPTDPTTLPTEPATEPTEPITVPTEPGTQPTEPKPTEPKPTEPTPTEPKPTEPFDEAAFFSESAFIGDSVTLALERYCITNKNALHGATILCAGSYAVRHAIDKVGGYQVVSVSYQGEKMRPEDALAACGAKRVFIMLGLNDIGLVGIDKTITNWGTLISNIRSKCPDIEIYIQSGTPIQLGGEKGSLNNTNMDKYNVKLEKFCKDNGCYFVNVAETLKNDKGGLREDYCSDDYCHLTFSGVIAWIQYVKEYAATQFGA